MGRVKSLAENALPAPVPMARGTADAHLGGIHSADDEKVYPHASVGRLARWSQWQVPLSRRLDINMNALDMLYRSID